MMSGTQVTEQPPGLPRLFHTPGAVQLEDNRTVAKDLGASRDAGWDPGHKADKCKGQLCLVFT